MKRRIIVSALIKNQDNEYLICKMPKSRGAYPGKWAIPGGGINSNETILEALDREIKEEIGEELIISKIIPWKFKDHFVKKLYPDGKIEDIYMICLIFDCFVENKIIKLNEEFEKYAWVLPENIKNYDLNEATKWTFQQKNLF